MKRCDKRRMHVLVGLLAMLAISCAVAAEAREAVDFATSVPMRIATDTSKILPAARDMTAPKAAAPKRMPPTVTLKRGQKQLFVPPGAVRRVDAAGNATIKLPDGRRIRILKGGRVEVLRNGKVIERGRFVGWQDKAGLRAGERMRIRAGRHKGIRAGERAGARMGGRVGARYTPATSGQFLIFR